jgi:hypothetical protein
LSRAIHHRLNKKYQPQTKTRRKSFCNMLLQQHIHLHSQQDRWQSKAADGRERREQQRACEEEKNEKTRVVCTGDAWLRSSSVHRRRGVEIGLNETDAPQGNEIKRSTKLFHNIFMRMLTLFVQKYFHLI